jgi:hypothetical protein
MDGAGQGLAGWTIQLLQANQVVQTAVTDAAGSFEFLGLGMGTYTVQEVQQAGWASQGPGAIAVLLNACDENLTGYAFVNVAGTSAPTASVPTTVAAPSIPTALPHTGESVPGIGALAVIFGVLLLSAGQLMLPAPAGSLTASAKTKYDRHVWSRFVRRSASTHKNKQGQSTVEDTS